MTPYTGCTRRYGIPHIAKSAPYLSEATASENSRATVSSHPKNGDSCECLATGEPLKRRRSRRGRARDYYAKAIAAFSTIYPKVFFGICPLVKIRPGDPTEESEKSPALISTLKQPDYEVPVLLSKSSNESDSPSSPQAEVPTWNPAVAEIDSGQQRETWGSPGFEPQTDEEDFVESLLDSPDGEGALDGILGGSGDSNPVPPAPACGFGDYACREEGTNYHYYYYSAIRGRQWHADCCRADDVASGHVASRSMRLADKIKAEREMNAMSFCSLDWLNRDDHHGLALKLDYDDILTAWSDRGSLYIDDQCPQTVPGDGDDDDVDSAMASVDVGLVPHLNFWRVDDENVVQCNYMAKDGCSTASASAVEDGKKAGIREARVLRYKEKRQTRLSSKKIRYEVRKINAERRPRIKGRFVKRLANL